MSAGAFAAIVMFNRSTPQPQEPQVIDVGAAASSAPAK